MTETEARTKVWESTGGTRQVVDIIAGKVFIKTGDSNLLAILPIEELEREIATDTSRLRRNEAEIIVLTPEQEKINAFAATFPAIRRPRIIATLSKSVTSGDNFVALAALINTKVQRGFTVVIHEKDKRRLSHRNGAYHTERDLTKTGIDFAEYLIKQLNEDGEPLRCGKCDSLLTDDDYKDEVSPTCSDCCCDSDDCIEQATQDSDFCIAHKCVNCDRERWEDSKYCDKCVCASDYCVNPSRYVEYGEVRNVFKDAIYCNECVCGADACEEAHDDDEEYCSYHTENVVLDSETDVLDYCEPDTPNEFVLAGVELEVECYNRQDEAAEIKYLFDGDGIVKEDSSLSSGVEIVTRPMTLENHRNSWKQWLDYMPSDTHIEDTCGLHVHISRQPLGDFAVGKILAFINSPEHKRFLVELARRESSPHAEFKPDCAKASDVKKDSGRYTALNVTNLNTIEFRLFRGTLEYSEIMQAIEFCFAISIWAKFNAGLQDLSLPKFAMFVAQNKKKYPNLYKFVEEQNIYKFWDKNLAKIVDFEIVFNKTKQRSLFG